MKEMRTEMRTEIRQMSDDVKDIKENCIRREEFVSHQLKLENKLDLSLIHISARTSSSALRPFLPALQRRHKLPVQLRMLRTQGTEELRL